jgi:hypothetical protein
MDQFTTRQSSPPSCHPTEETVMGWAPASIRKSFAAFLCAAVLVAFSAGVQGQVVGPEIPIWIDGSLSRTPSVAYNSVHGEFLVVWYNEQGPDSHDVYARRVGLDGSLGSWFSVVAVAGEKHSRPVVAYNPIRDEYLVVWVFEYSAVDTDIMASFVSWDGGFIGAPFSVDNSTDPQFEPDVAFNDIDDEYLVVYTNALGGTAEIGARRIDGDGSLLNWANVATAPATLRHRPSAAFNPDLGQYLIVYNYIDPVQFYDLVHGKVAAANLNGISGAPEILIYDDATQFDANVPMVAAAGDGYLVQFLLLNFPISRRVAADGTPLGPATGFLVGSPAGTSYAVINHPTAVATTDAVGVVSVWQDMDGSSGDIDARSLSPRADLHLSPQHHVSNGPRDEEEAAVACTPWGTCLVVHQSDTDIIGRMLRFNIFGDGFEVGSTAQWSAGSP